MSLLILQPTKYHTGSDPAAVSAAEEGGASGQAAVHPHREGATGNAPLQEAPTAASPTPSTGALEGALEGEHLAKVEGVKLFF